MARPLDRNRDRAARRKHLPLLVLASLVLVPLAGASDPPIGWLSAAVGAIAVVLAYRLIGGRAAMGWLLLLVGCIGLVASSRSLATLGPALFVAAALLTLVWLTSAPVGRSRRRMAPDDDADREAQQNMGRSGEQQVRNTLAAELPEPFVLLNGLTLPRCAGDIDHVVVGPTGLFVLETKTMAGIIECDPDGTWRRTKIGRAGTAYGGFIGDPARQAQQNIAAVRASLKRRLPHLFSGTPLWIEGLVVFAHPRTQLETEHSPVPALRLVDTAARIQTNRPRRPLQPKDVVDVTAALLQERMVATPLRLTAPALVEVALVMPILLSLVFGIVALSRVLQAHSAVVTVAHEVARAGALGVSAEDAQHRMQLRVEEVLPGLGLDRRMLEVTSDVSAFRLAEGQVRAQARYRLDLSDLPLLGWAPPLQLRVEHREWVDPYRAGVQHAAEAGP